MTESDTRLWRRWLERRDEVAYTALVRSHGAFAIDFAARLTGNATDAEDLSQQAFLELAEETTERPVEVGLRAFLGRRMVLAARTATRTRRSRRRREQRAARRLAREDDPAPRLDAAAALEVLTEAQRTVLALRFLHGLSYSEIAYALGLSETAARMRVHRALRVTRSRLRSPLALALLARSETAAAHLGGTLLVGWKAKQLVFVLLLLATGLSVVVWTRIDRNAKPRHDLAQIVPVRPAADSARVSTPPDQTTARSAVTPPRSRGVRGVLRYVDGTPATGLRVGLARNGRFGITDAAGRFVMGDDTLEARRENKRRWLAEKSASSRLVDLVANKGLRGDTLVFRVLGRNGSWVTIGRGRLGGAADLTVEPGQTLTGSVRANGQWLARAAVRLRRRDYSEGEPVQARRALARTDENGRFRFGLLLPGDYDLSVADHGPYTPYAATVEIRDRPAVHAIELAPAEKWTIRFENLPESMREAEVHIQLFGGPWPGGRQWLRRIEDGALVLPAPPDGPYVLHVHPPRRSDGGFPPLSRQIVVPGAVIFRLPLGGVRGRVLNAAGKPVAGERLILSGNGAGTRTDAMGRFLFEAVPAGRVRIGLGPVTVHEIDVPEYGLIDAEVRVTGTAVVEGRLRAGSERCYILLKRSDDAREVARTRVKSGGTFRLEHLPAGRYDLVLSTRNGPETKRRVTLSASTRLDLGTVELAVYPRVPVVVTFPPGAKQPPRLRARVAVAGKRGGYAVSIWLNDMNRGSLTGLPAGEYTLTFVAPGLQAGPTTVHVADYAPVLTIDLQETD